MLLQGKITRLDHLHASRKKLRTKPCFLLRKQALASFQDLRLVDLAFPTLDHIQKSLVLEFFDAGDANEPCSIQKGEGHPLLDTATNSVEEHLVEINTCQRLA